jgi:predicted DsbA family dithiol-disulfide isomerase
LTLQGSARPGVRVALEIVMTHANASNASDRRRSHEASQPARVLEIEVWFDFVCPWCFIGKRNLDAALRMLRPQHPGASIEIEWHPHPLLPETPAEGLPYTEFYRQRLGGADAVALRQAQVAESARSAGIVIAFDRIQVLPSTLAAHRLAVQAQREVPDGGAHAGKVIDALFREYFVLGQDIGRPDVLQAVAARCGITGDPDAWPLPKSSPAAHGVPLFRFGGAVTLVGAQPPEALLEAMEQALGARW